MDASIDSAVDAAPVDGTVDVAPDAACPVPGSACATGTSSLGCVVNEWPGVMSWRCVDARWCVYPQNPGLYVDPDAGCPEVVPAAGAACSGPAASRGYGYCPYVCGDGTTHAMVCAGATSVWCGDAVAGCALKVRPTADVGIDGD